MRLRVDQGGVGSAIGVDPCQRTPSRAERMGSAIGHWHAVPQTESDTAENDATGH